MQYCTLVRPKLEYASVAWNTGTSTDGSTIEHIQQKFLSLCHNYVTVIHYLKSRSFKFRGVTKYALFYLMITVAQNVDLQLWKLSVFVCQIKNPDFTLFNVDFECRDCPSARCAISTDNGIRNEKSVLLNDSLN